MRVFENVREKVKFYIAGVMRRFSKMHVLHDYYVVSDQRDYTGFRLIIERCRICGKMKDNLDC